MRDFQVKYEMLNNQGTWEEFSRQVIGTTTINLGNIAEVGSEDFGIDSLKKFANLTIHNDKNMGLTSSPILETNEFQAGRRIRIKVRTAKSTKHYNLSEKGLNTNYIFLQNIERMEQVKISSVYDGIQSLTPKEANLEITNTIVLNNGLYVYFNREVKDYEIVNLLLIVTAEDLDSDRVEIEGMNKDTYFIPNVNPDVIEIIGYYKYDYVRTGEGYFEALYFTELYGVDYLYYAKADDPENFPYWITEVSQVKEGDKVLGINIKTNKPIPNKERLVIGLYYADQEDIIIFDGKIKSYEGVGYHEVNIECQDFSYDLDVMAINEEYPEGQTFETTIRSILNNNGFTEIEFLYDAENTATLTEKYVIENITIWEAIQNLALAKGWSLYFQYNREKNKQVLLFEDTVSASYITYQILKKDLIEEFTYSGDLKRVRNIVEVIYKDKNDGNKTKTIELRDQDSIDRYRQNRITLGLDVTENVINTEERARKFAEQALADLKDPTVSYSMSMDLMPKLKLNDELWYFHENITDKPLYLRAYSIQHNIEVDDTGNMNCYTTITGGGKVKYKLNKWLYNDTNIQEDKEIIIYRR